MKDHFMYELESSGSRQGSKLTTTSVVGFASAFLMIMGATILYTTSNNEPASSSMTSFVETTKQSDFYWTFGRVNYETVPYFNRAVDQIATYKFLEDYVAVIEPHSNMELRLYDTSMLEDTTKKFYYKICGADGSNCNEGVSYKTSTGGSVSQSFKYPCSPYDTFKVELHMLNAETGEIITSRSGEAVCLYVRREIRSLTQDDLTKFMDVSYELWKYDTKTGQEKYGAGYKPNSVLLHAHHFNAGQVDADHIHEGQGFLTQHLKLTNDFEVSLQAVDPSVHLPYWDFTIDDSLHETVSNSFVMSENIYGGMHVPKDILKGYSYEFDRIEDGRITSGRWKDLKAEYNNGEYPQLMFGYGYMRAPWSMNPSPYISRFTSVFDEFILLPTCDMHYSILYEHDDMMDFFNSIAYEPHATVHTLSGGIYGCDLLFPLIDKGYIKDINGAYGICKGWTFNLKEWYRHNYIIPRKNCKVNPYKIEDSRCGFDCNMETWDSLMSFVSATFTKYGDVNKEGFEEEMKKFICDGGDGGRIFPGDHLESASPADPSFWVIHPTMERLLQAKLMAGGFKSEAFHTDPIKQYVCNKAKCYKDDKKSTDYFESCCYGHYENDQLMDYDPIKNEYTYYGMTNKEVVIGTDPRTNAYNMPYIYDKFTWDHCTGLDFQTLLYNMKNGISVTPSATSAGGVVQATKKTTTTTTGTTTGTTSATTAGTTSTGIPATTATTSTTGIPATTATTTTTTGSTTGIPVTTTTTSTSSTTSKMMSSGKPK